MLKDIEIPMIKVSYTTNSKPSERNKISGSESAILYFRQIWDNDTLELYEEFKVLYLNRSNHIIGLRNLGRGSTAGVLVDTKLIFSIGVACNCSSLILCHNHPSGNLRASEADKVLTGKIKQICTLFEIQLFDHIILTSNGYYSFADEGLIGVRSYHSIY